MELWYEGSDDEEEEVSPPESKIWPCPMPLLALLDAPEDAEPPMFSATCDIVAGTKSVWSQKNGGSPVRVKTCFVIGLQLWSASVPEDV